ncbi:uncharacterized protein DNG_07792 [Cephalotrichum gorgonifer]|uniref:Uncharacterized protein n=1 Tax=Cephalotrichum gorgonifer TaxID=2041049 RepID=A0AAE8N333_9PEZI|nr:uncharacterized protein DNG_07792 [Cephalotrichum gorgonifer]
MSSSHIWGSIPFPPGDNDTDTAFGGGHFNLTVLNELDYHLFENGTVSNFTKCFLAFQPYTPTYLFPNGTFQNHTSCYTALYPIGVRSGTGIGFGVLFGIALILTLVNLRKHGALYVERSKRFFPISRRWQWYWSIIVCGLALVSLFTNVDVDRYYVMNNPIIFTSFFWFLMQFGIISLVWEAVRHWGSWNERQIVDANPYAVRQEGRRYNTELLLPIFFYFWVWLNFFLIIPRSWTSIQLQRSPEQILIRAKPAATDGRFKAAGFCLFVAWLTIIGSLAHSIKHLHTRRDGAVGKVMDTCRSVPIRFVLLLLLALFIVAFQILVAFQWDYSPLNAKGNVVAIYMGGYVPTLLILAVQTVYGFIAPNEDLELIRQRRERGEETNRELGIVPKPSWWSRLRGNNQPASMRDIVARNVNEISGKQRTAPAPQPASDASPTGPGGGDVELTEPLNKSGSQPMSPGAEGAPPYGTPSYGGSSEQRRTERTMRQAPGILFPASDPASPSRAEEEAPPSYDESTARRGVSRNGSERGTTPSISNQPPQQIRSMLDV